jgi:hypothetical protein
MLSTNNGCRPVRAVVIIGETTENDRKSPSGQTPLYMFDCLYNITLCFGSYRGEVFIKDADSLMTRSGPSLRTDCINAY